MPLYTEKQIKTLPQKQLSNGAVLEFLLPAQRGVTLTLAEAFTGLNLNFFASADLGRSWLPVKFTKEGGTSAISSGVISSSSDPTVFTADLTKFTAVRVVCSALASGTPTLVATSFTPAVSSSSQAAGGEVTFAAGQKVSLDASNALIGRVLCDEATDVGTTTSLNNTTASASFPISGKPTLSFQVFGTFVATLTLEVSLDGGVTCPWIAAGFVAQASGARVTTVTGAGINKANLSGIGFYRFKLSAYTSGTVNIFHNLTTADMDSSPTTQAVSLSSLPALVASSALIGQVNLSASTSGSAGGLSNHYLESAASINATIIKNTTGKLYSLHIFNSVASVRYIKFYNKTSAPVPGTDTPVFKFVIPANFNGYLIIPNSYGRSFTTGIAYVITANLVNTDTTAIGAGDIIVNAEFG